MRGDTRPLPNMPSWRGAQLKHRDNFAFLYVNSYEISNSVVGGCRYMYST